MSGDYASFLAGKQRAIAARGRKVSDGDIHPLLHPWQRRIVAWAVERGRVALWETGGMRPEADRIVAGPARVAGDEHGAYCRERARTLRACASELAAVLATQPPAPDDMFERAYMEVQEILDEALGTEEEDGAGAGMAADVALLADRLKAAEAEVMRLKGGTPLPGMPGAEL